MPTRRADGESTPVGAAEIARRLRVKRQAAIDWEYSTLGDPAYDLAIVTRGVRRPFQADDGFERLLEAYVGAGGANVSVTQVRLHELCLGATWYREALTRRTEPRDQALARFRAILRQALASSR